MTGKAFEMKTTHPSRAFSLIEVIIAIAIFALAAVIMLQMLPSLARSAGETGDALAAQGISGALQVEIARQIATNGLVAVADQVPVMGSTLADGMTYVAARSGGVVSARDEFLPAPELRLPESSQYFLIETWRFAQPPLAYSAGDDVLVLFVRVSWPYRVPGAGEATPPPARRQTHFVLSLQP